MKIIKVFFYLFFYTSLSNGQEFKIYKLSNKNNFSNHEIDTITLPFWEDFSAFNYPNNNNWSESENIKIKNYNNNYSPSINIVEFDGTDNNGKAYQHASGYGISDELISDIINLNNFNEGDSIYMSFFWNYNINGEYPDYEDTLKLMFLNKFDIWETVWYKNGGNNNFNGNYFNYEILNFTSNYIHKNFKFKFQNIGNTEGPFDSWVLDYIYINNERSINDSSFIDRTLSYKEKKIFKEYNSIPIDHFTDSDNIMDSLEMEIKNLDKNIQPVNYSYLIKSHELNLDLKIEFNKQLSPILNGYERRSIKNKPFNISSYNSSKDSLEMEVLFYIDSGDSSSTNFNLRINDTSRTKILFSNYYSYDDGNAEYAAGLNQKNSEVVLKYNILSEDTLTQIMILFPESYNNEYQGDIELVIYDNLFDIENKLVGMNTSISYNDSIFNVFTLNTPLIVKDSIFIGYRQFEDNFLTVGLDKNNNMSNKIYYKIDGKWNKNNVVKGSMMIRPIFGKSDFSLVKIENNHNSNNIVLFPNPSKGIIYINKKLEFIEVFSNKGESLFTLRNADRINLSDYGKGLFIIKYHVNNKYYSNKIVIN